MKIAFIFAVLCVTVAIYGVNAEIDLWEDDSFLQEIDSGIANQNEYLIISRIVKRGKELLQKALEKVKGMGSGDILSSFKQSIADIQERINRLTGGLGFVEKYRDIRERLSSLLKNVFDKINDLASYEAVEEEDSKQTLVQRLTDRLREIVQKGLDNLRQKLADAKVVSQNILGKIAEIQEKLKEAGNAVGKNLLDKVFEARQKLRDLLKEVKEKITPSGLYAALDEDDEEEKSVVGLIISHLKSIAQQGIDKVKIALAGKKEVFEKVKGKIAEIQQKIKELGQKTSQRLVEKIKSLRQSLLDLAKDVKERLGNAIKSKYDGEIVAEIEEKSLIRTVADHLKDLAQRALDKVKETLGNRKEIFEQVKAKIADIQEKIQNLAKSAGGKLVEKIQEIRQKLSELVRDVKQRITGKTNYDMEEEQTRVGKSIIVIVKRGIEMLKSKLAEHKDVFEKVKGKLADLQNMLKEFGKQAGGQLVSNILGVREKFLMLVEEVKALIGLSGVSSYVADDLVTNLAMFKTFAIEHVDEIRAYIENIQSTHPGVNFVKLFVESSESDDLKELFRELFSNIPNGVAVNGDIKNIVERIYQSLRTDAGLSRLRNYANSVTSTHPIVMRLKGIFVTASDDGIRDFLDVALGGKFYSSLAVMAAEIEEESDTLVTKLIKSMKFVTQFGLDKLRELVGKQKEVFEGVKEKIEEIQRGLNELTKQSLAKAITTISNLNQKLKELTKTVLDKVTGKFSIDDEDEIDEDVDEKDQTLVGRLIQRIRERNVRLLNKLKDMLSKQKEIAHDVKDKIDEIQERLKDLAHQTGVTALANVRAINKKIGDLTKTVVNRITGKSKYDSNEEEYDGHSAMIDRLVEKIRFWTKVNWDRVTTVLNRREDIAAEVQDRVDDIMARFARLDRENGAEALITVRILQNKVNDIRRAVDKLGGRTKYESADPSELLANLKAFKKHIYENMNELRAIVESHDTEDPTLALFQLVVVNSDDSEIMEMFDALLPMDQNDRPAKSSFPDVIAYLKKAFLEDPNGVKIVKGHFASLQTSHPVVMRLQNLVASGTDERVREVIGGILNLGG